MTKLRRIGFGVCALAVVALCAAPVAAQARFSHAAPRRTPVRAAFAAPTSVNLG